MIVKSITWKLSPQNKKKKKKRKNEKFFTIPFENVELKYSLKYAKEDSAVQMSELKFQYSFL